MTLRPATAVPRGERLDCDVAVVGAGPAGLAVALALAGAGVRVTVLEAGGRPGEAAEDPEPPEIDADGDAAFARDGGFGGTRWYGRCVLPERADFDVAEDWPVAYEEIAGLLPAAARWLGLPRPAALDAATWRGEPAWRALSGDGLAPRAHLMSPRADLGRRHRRAAARGRSIDVLLGAALVGIDVAAGGDRVERLRFAAADGGERALRARRTVLAAGAIENARQLLLLAEAHPGALGVSQAAVGRGFVDHPRCDGVARLRLDAGFRESLAVYRRLVVHRAAAAGCRMQLAVGFGAELRRRERLLDACGFFYPVSRPRVAALGAAVERLRASAAAGRPRRGDLARFGALLAAAPVVAAAAAARGARRPFALDHLALVEQLEQRADDGGRVELAAARDRHGRRRARVVWRVGETTRVAQRRFHELLERRLRRAGVGRLESPLLAAEPPAVRFGDGAHPMGTTRMSRRPEAGVVDPDLRVHAFADLHVAGASVLPSLGSANPTLTLVALAMRLAERLRALD